MFDGSDLPVTLQSVASYCRIRAKILSVIVHVDGKQYGSFM